MEAYQCPNCVMKFKDQGLLSKHLQRFCGTKLKETAAEVIDGYAKKKTPGMAVGADEVMLFLRNGGDIGGEGLDSSNLNLLREDVAKEERELDKLMKGLLNRKDVNSHNAKGEIAEKKEFLAKKKFDLERELIEMSKRIEQKRVNELQARVFKERALGAIDGVDRNMLLQVEKQRQAELADIDAERTRLAEQEAEAMREIEALERRIRGGASSEEKGSVLQRASQLSEQQVLAFKHGKKAAEYSVQIEVLTEKKDQLSKNDGRRTRADTPQDQVLAKIKNTHGEASDKVQRMKAEHKAMLDQEARDARHFFEEMEKLRPEGARLPPKTFEGYSDNIADFAQDVEQEVEMSGRAWQEMQDDIEGLVEYRKEQLENDAVRNAMIRSAPERGNASQAGLRESLDDIDMIRSQRPTAATGVTPPLSDRMVRPSPRAGQRLSPEISGYGGMGGSQYMGSPHYGAAGPSTSHAMLGGGSSSLEEVRRLREEYINGGGRDPVILTSLDELERDARHNMAAVPPPAPADPYSNPALAMMQRQLQHSNEILSKLAEDNERLQTEIEESASGTKAKHQLDEQQKQLKKAMNLVQKHLGGDAEREEARLREEEDEIMETMNFDMSGLEDDVELQQLHMEHVREMTKMRFEIQKFKQLSRLEKLKQDLDRERLLEQKKLDNELWQTEQQRRLQEARVRQLLGKEGGVTSITANDGIYKPQTGFALFFDYAIGLPKRVKEVCLVYQFFFKAEAKTPVKALDICEAEDEDPSHSLVVLSQERRFTKVAAIPNLKVICVIQEVVSPAQGPSQGPKMQALGWALIDLFTADRKLRSGLWRLPTFRPPVNPGKTMGEMNDLGKLPSMELFLRLVHADNVATHQQMKIDPTYTKGEYKVPQEYGGAAAIPTRPREPVENAPMSIEDVGPSQKKEAPGNKGKVEQNSGKSVSQDTVGVTISKAKDVTTDKPLVLKLRLFHGSGVVSGEDGSPLEYTTRPGATGRGPISVLTWNEKTTFKFLPDSNEPTFLTVEVMEEQADGNYAMQAWFYTQLKGLENGGKIRSMTATLKPLWKGPYITLPEKPRKTSAWNKKMSLGVTIYDPQEAIIKAEREKRKTNPQEEAADSVEGVPEDLFYAKKIEPPDEKLGVDESVNFYVDGARFLPENIILSSIQLSIYDKRWTLVGAMEEKECDADHFTMSPVYEMRKGFRGRLDDPSLCALIQVNGLDMYERRVVLVGFAIINLFVKEGTADPASSSDEYCLNAGAFQIPVKRGTPNPKINLQADALDPCENVGVASLLVRIEKFSEGRRAQVERPDYQTRVYDTSRCHPTEVEKQMYSRLQSTRDQAVRDVLAGMDKTGKLSSLPKDQLQKFIKSKMKTDGEVAWMNFNYMIKYNREAGLQIAVDGGQNMPQQLMWTVVSIVPPNNFYSKENLTDDVRFTQLNDLKADVKAPRWMDGFWKFHPNFKPESCAIFDVRAMADSNDTSSDDSDDEGEKKKKKSKGAATKSIGWGVLPIFSGGGHVLAGSYQIPLFDGAVSMDYVKDGLQYGSIPQVVSAAFDKKKLKSKNNMTLFVRLVDRQRSYEFTEPFVRAVLKKPGNDKFLKFKPANKTLEKQAGKIGRSKVAKINPQQWIDEQAREFASALNLKMMY